jgi:hypothetical protein
MDEKVRCVDRVLFTDRYGVTRTISFVEDQILWIDGRPPKFISYDCKLWEFYGMGMRNCFYHEVESFVQVS